MFSLHIDTARTWRGGQSQVMYTVLGLRQIDQRAALVAHPQGALYRRMSEGLDLIPLAPMHEIERAGQGRVAGGVGCEIFPAECQRSDELRDLCCRCRRRHG